MRFLTAAAFACVLSLANSAHATLVVYICDDQLCTGGGDTIVADQGAGDNFPGSTLVGQVNAGALNIAGFTIATNVAQSKPALGSSGLPQMDITFSAVTSDNFVHTLYLYASDTGFTAGGIATLSLGGTQTPGTAGNSVVGSAFGGTSNTNFSLTNLFATTGTSSASPFALQANGLLAGVNPYSLTLGVAITRSAPGTTNGDLNLSIAPASTGVPEPSSIMLAGIALMGLAVASRGAVRR